MEIIINGKKAVLKKGVSIEYVTENRLFTEADDFTLSIPLPLKDCKTNTEIFGKIDRMDRLATRVTYNCEIVDKSFRLRGAAAITEVSESEVKLQFLGGRSAQNFDESLDDKYINEMDLGSWPTSPNARWLAWYSGDPLETKCVALPWVNSKSGNMQNEALWEPMVEAGAPAQFIYPFTDGTDANGTTKRIYNQHLSWQPYLIYLTSKIAEEAGYKIDLTPWANSDDHKYLLVCNTLPYAWGISQFARALPHWTVKEYFEKLELFLGAQFDFDHARQTITMNFIGDILSNLPNETIENVVDEYSSELSAPEDSDCEYIESKNLFYKEQSHEMQKFYSCDWLIRQANTFKWMKKEFETLKELIEWAKPYRQWNGSHFRTDRTDMNSVFYAKDVDMYFILKAESREEDPEYGVGSHYKYIYSCILQPINWLGGRIVDKSKTAKSEEMEFVPAWIDATDEEHGQCLFLDPGDYDEPEETTTTLGKREDNDSTEASSEDEFAQFSMVTKLKDGEPDELAEYYDCIYVGHWDGIVPIERKSPFPKICDVILKDDWSGYIKTGRSLRINNATYQQKRGTKEIDKTQKTTFKFLSDRIPEPKSIFYIRGKRYLCEKITATITEAGLSRLLKGVFYPIKENLI